jgi:hypothetical protein
MIICLNPRGRLLKYLIMKGLLFYRALLIIADFSYIVVDALPYRLPRWHGFERSIP